MTWSYQPAKLRHSERAEGNIRRKNPQEVNPYDAHSSGGLVALVNNEKIRQLDSIAKRAWAEARKYTQADNPEVYEHARQAQRRYYRAKYGK